MPKSTGKVNQWLTKAAQPSKAAPLFAGSICVGQYFDIDVKSPPSEKYFATSKERQGKLWKEEKRAVVLLLLDWPAFWSYMDCMALQILQRFRYCFCKSWMGTNYLPHLPYG